jgi:hypothetical protein
MECLVGWLVFSLPFLAFTAPLWLPLPRLAALLLILGLLFIVWFDVGYIIQLAGTIKRHRGRDFSQIASDAREMIDVE